jgi:hypothetical protein
MGVSFDEGVSRTIRVLRILAILCAVWLVSDRLARGQTVSLDGRVVDKSGAALPGLRVRLIDDTGGSLRAEIYEFTTDSNGHFEVHGVPPGIYDIQVSAPGFKAKSLKNVQIGPGGASGVTITLDEATSAVAGGEKGNKTGQGRVGEKGSKEEAAAAVAGGEKGNETSQAGVGEKGSNEEATTPVWNAWAERSSAADAGHDRPNYSPVVKLRNKGRTYNLWIELSAFAYTSEPGIFHQAGSESLKEWVLNTTDAPVLDVLVIPDARVFEPKSSLVHLSINIQKLRDSLDHKFNIPSSPLASLRAGDDSFSFGRVAAQLETREDAVGRGAVAVSFWSQGIPLDEIAVPFCVVESEEDACAASAPVTVGLRGIDSIRIAAQKSSFFPDAALHFLDLGTGQVIGVFRCNTCKDWNKEEFAAWQIDRSAQFIGRYLKKTIIPDFQNKATTTKGFRNHGRDLFSLLFRGKRSANAKDKFLKFLNSFSEQDYRAGPPPSIFVRLLPTNPEPLFLVPLGLMYVPAYKDFIGFHFRVETPLENQDYTTPQGCISTWTLFVPQRNDNNQFDDLQKARTPLSEYIEQFRQWKEHSVVYEDVDLFRDWLLNDRGESKYNDAIFILSHHDANRIFFDSTNTIESVSVQREFSVPTFVMLDGCGTAAPGALEFVREFNKRGATAQIAAATEIDPVMAGKFAATFIKNLQEHETDDTYSVARAEFDAAREVSDLPMTSREKYGPRTLVYTMLGNAALRVCAPSTK